MSSTVFLSTAQAGQDLRGRLQHYFLCHLSNLSAGVWNFGVVQERRLECCLTGHD
jgi:hypothetical protein